MYFNRERKPLSGCVGVLAATGRLWELSFSSRWAAKPGLSVFQKLLFTRGSRRERGAVNPQLPEKPQETVNLNFFSPLKLHLCVNCIWTDCCSSCMSFVCMWVHMPFCGFPSVSFTLLFPVVVHVTVCVCVTISVVLLYSAKQHFWLKNAEMRISPF